MMLQRVKKTISHHRAVTISKKRRMPQSRSGGKNGHRNSLAYSTQRLWTTTPWRMARGVPPAPKNEWYTGPHTWKMSTNPPARTLRECHQRRPILTIFRRRSRSLNTTTWGLSMLRARSSLRTAGVLSVQLRLRPRLQIQFLLQLHWLKCRPPRVHTTMMTTLR